MSGSHDHTEEREFSIHLHVKATFAEDYEGDEDGFVWAETFDRKLRPRLLAAVFDVLKSEPGFSAVAAPRGSSPDRAVDVDVAFSPGVRALPIDPGLR